MHRARTDFEKDQRRIDLLNAAIDEFFEKGFSAARLDDIAARAGVSKGSVYLYFKSKEELFTSLTNLHAKPVVDFVIEQMNNTSSIKDLATILTEFVPNTIRQTRVPQLIKILIGDAPNFPEMVAEYRQNVIDRVLLALTELIKRSQTAGDVRDCDPAMAARLTISPMVLSSIWTIVVEPSGGDRLDIRSLIKTHFDILLRGLAPDDAEKARP